MITNFFKYIESINEDFKNDKLVRWYLRTMLKEIQKLCSDIQILDKEDAKKYFKFSFRIIKTNKVENIVKKYKDKLLRVGIYMSYHLSEERETSLGDDLEIVIVKNGKIYQTFYIYCKEISLKLVKPSEFVYHTSSKSNRKSILEHGLLAKENLNYSDVTSLNHPPAVFATLNHPVCRVGGIDTDVYEIDTKNLPNKWYKDMNLIMQFGEDIAIMTFDNIPKEYIKLMNENSY